ncbi:MAG TPA: ankyrin repeat domain-containing protein [Novosphingobium sp.]|nr:ankyrin repeat domain-containing protein [Novosphingobium sp.]
MRILLPALVAALAFAGQAHAQFSAGYKFLEAVKKKNGTEVTEALNEPGSTIVNTRDLTTGETALHIVTGKRDLTWMAFLLSRGANANARDVRGVTPLVLAANLGFIEGVELLIARGARLDESNQAGETPLISAVHSRSIGLMRILLKAGADPDRADNSGRSARDYALLDGRNSPLVGEIETSAKPRGQRQGRPTYGPTL